MVDLTKKPYNLSIKQITYIKNKVQQMSTAEKVGQLFFVIGQDENSVDIPEFIHKYQPGGMMYRPDAAKKIKREITTAQEASTVPMFFAANLESGGNGLIQEGTWFGMPLQMAATDDSNSAYQLGNV
ncbi:glycoside hydrolase family 3 N-terminal domain-containing protein, partial [Lactiplantibacillus plantarum]